jgi:hypothetical protein
VYIFQHNEFHKFPYYLSFRKCAILPLVTPRLWQSPQLPPGSAQHGCSVSSCFLTLADAALGAGQWFEYSLFLLFPTPAEGTWASNTGAALTGSGRPSPASGVSCSVPALPGPSQGAEPFAVPKNSFPRCYQPHWGSCMKIRWPDSLIPVEIIIRRSLSQLQVRVTWDPGSHPQTLQQSQGQRGLGIQWTFSVCWDGFRNPLGYQNSWRLSPSYEICTAPYTLNHLQIT